LNFQKNLKIENKIEGNRKFDKKKVPENEINIQMFEIGFGFYQVGILDEDCSVPCDTGG